MTKIIDFDDLEEEVRLQYLTEAYDELYAHNQIPYGVSTADDQIWSDYDPVISLAIKNYNSSFEEWE